FEEVRGAKFQFEHYYFEAVSKGEAVKVVEQELKQSQTVLEMHQIRSRVRGVIRKIYKHPGEAVRPLEPVFQIELAPENAGPSQKKRDEGGRPKAKDDLQSLLDRLRLLDTKGDPALSPATDPRGTRLELEKADLIEKIISRTQPHKREPLLRQLV